MAESTKKPPRVSTIAINDHDTICSVEVFNSDGRYSSYAEALDKLVARAVRARLHKMTDAQFERLVDSMTSAAAA